MNHSERFIALNTEMAYCDDQVLCSNCLLHPYCDWCADAKEFTDDELQKLVDIIEQRVPAETMQLIRKYNSLKSSLHTMCSTEKCGECPYGEREYCEPCELVILGMNSYNYPDFSPYDDKNLADMIAALETVKEALETKTVKEMPDFIKSFDYTTAIVEEEDGNE